MTFELVDEIVLRTSYFVFADFKILRIPAELATGPDEPVIAALMASPFHLWQGEDFPDGFSMTWTWDRDGKKVDELLHGVKVFGHYDLNRLSAADYRPVDREELESSFFAFVEKHTVGDSDYLRDIRHTLDRLTGPDTTIYWLDLSPDRNPEKVSQIHNAFTFFTALIARNVGQHTVILIEFGQD